MSVLASTPLGGATQPSFLSLKEVQHGGSTEGTSGEFYLNILRVVVEFVSFLLQLKTRMLSS